MTIKTESREVIEELLTYLSEFFKQTNPDPIVAITAIEIYKNQLFVEDIFDLMPDTDTYVYIHRIHINDDEIEEFLSLLNAFVDESREKIKDKAVHPYPPTSYIISMLEIAKYRFLSIK